MTEREAEEIAYRARTWARSAVDFELRLILTEAAEAIEWLVKELEEPDWGFEWVAEE